MSYSSAPQWQGSSQSHAPPSTGPGSAQSYQPDPLSNAMSSMSLSNTSAGPSATITSPPTMPYYYEPSSQNMNHPVANQQQPTTIPTPPASYGNQLLQAPPATHPQGQTQPSEYAVPQQTQYRATNSQTPQSPQSGSIPPPPSGYPNSPYTMNPAPQAGQTPPQVSSVPSTMSIPSVNALAPVAPLSAYTQELERPDRQYQQSPPSYSMGNNTTIPAYAWTNQTYPIQQTQPAPATQTYNGYQSPQAPVTATSPAPVSYAPSPAPPVQQPYQTAQPPQVPQGGDLNSQAPPSNPTYVPGHAQTQRPNTYPHTIQYPTSQVPVQAQATKGAASSYYGMPPTNASAQPPSNAHPDSSYLQYPQGQQQLCTHPQSQGAPAAISQPPAQYAQQPYTQNYPPAQQSPNYPAQAQQYAQYPHAANSQGAAAPGQPPAGQRGLGSSIGKFWGNASSGKKIAMGLGGALVAGFLGYEAVEAVEGLGDSSSSGSQDYTASSNPVSGGNGGYTGYGDAGYGGDDGGYGGGYGGAGGYAGYSDPNDELLAAQAANDAAVLNAESIDAGFAATSAAIF